MHPALPRGRRWHWWLAMLLTGACMASTAHAQLEQRDTPDASGIPQMQPIPDVVPAPAPQPAPQDAVPDEPAPAQSDAADSAQAGSAGPVGPQPEGTNPHAIPTVVADAGQSHIDLTTVAVRLRSDRETLLPGPTPLVLSDDEVDFARIWLVFSLQNPHAEPQTRVLSVDRAALWGSGIAPVRSGLAEVGTWRATPSTVTPPERLPASARAHAGEVRYLLTLPPATTASFAVPVGAAARTPLHLWDADALAAADAGRSSFAGLIIGSLAIAFAFFAAQWMGQVSGQIRSQGASAIAHAYSSVRLAALLTGAALVYELAAQGFFAAIFGWSGGWDARISGALLALATGAGAHVLAAERIRALSEDRERLARLAGWGALASALLVLVLPSVGLPFIRLMAFAVALGGVAALTAGSGLPMSGGRGAATRITPAAGELRAGWALIAVAATMAALATQGFLPRSPIVEMIIHALAVLGTVVAAYALAGPSTISAVRTATRRTFALGQGAAAQKSIAAARPDAAAIRAEQRNALALAGASEAVWDLDVASGRLYVDPSLEAHLGLVPGALCGRFETWMARVDREQRRHVSQVLDENVERGNATFTLEMQLAHADPAQGTRWLELKATCFAGTAGTARRCVGTIADITRRREAQAGLVREALLDPLTGLANRPLFTDRLNRACRRAKGTHERIALVLADLDRFKSVNESLGHAVADTVLAALANRLQALIAPEDTLARIDGDTFAMLVAGWSDETGPTEIAQMMRDAIAQPMEVSGREIFPTASIGFTVREPHHESGETLLSEADIALRRAKRQSDAVCQFHPDMRPADDELATESGLRRALEREEIRLVYQPIMALETGHLAGFEALIRWQHPQRGLISPDEFVPLAERTGMIIELGEFVLDRAASDLALWQKDFPQTPPLFSSVNVSSRQLLDDLPGKVAALLKETALPPSSLRLEVTESLVMEDPDHAAGILKALKQTGVKLALDDFGTGYSSLSYLQRFPFDVVKIDKSFVQKIGSDEDAGDAIQGGDGAIVRSVLSLAGELKLDVVAEGIEDDAARALLQSLGCTYGQGFLFGQPMDADAAHDFIARHIE